MSMIQKFRAVQEAVCNFPWQFRVVLTGVSLLPSIQLYFLVQQAAYLAAQGSVAFSALKPFADHTELLGQYSSAGLGVTNASMIVLAINTILTILAPITWLLLWKRPTPLPRLNPV